MKKSINAWCFPNEFTAKRCIKLAKAAGFDGIELNMSEQGGPGPALDASITELRELRNLAEREELEISGLSTALLWSFPLTANDPKISAKGMRIVETMLRAAKTLGTDSILVVPGLVEEAVSYKTAYSRAQGALRELAETAKEEGVTLCVENVWNKFLLSPLEMARLLDEIGSEYVQAYFDAGNVLQFGYPQHWVEVLGGRIRRVHVKDFRCEAGNMSGFTHLLQGDLNWPMLMKALRGTGYDGYVTAELSPYQYDPEGIAPDTARQMDAIFAMK